MINSLGDIKQLDETFIPSIITKELGPLSKACTPNNSMTQASPQYSDYQQALANLLLDISPVSSESTPLMHPHHLLLLMVERLLGLMGSHYL